MARVVVGLSGGVDSAVSALLALQQGHEVIGLFMKNWDDDEENGQCSAEHDLADAILVAQRLQIPLQTVNFTQEYWQDVFKDFLEEYRAGYTPNPDVLCNKHIKFKAFLKHALSLGAEKIVMGHYAGVDHQDGLYRLLCAKDTNKDQCYFLHQLDQEALSYALFPLQPYTKPEVRAMALAHQLHNHDRKDSTG
ncbi:MAG: asparagine synthase-related protein, partial [Pseudomonadota bacterium]